MLPSETIRSAVERIVAAANPTKVILFGSYAREEATEDSDLDLMVVEPRVDNRIEEMARLRDAVGLFDIGVDVLVYSEQEFDERRQWLSSVVRWAVEEGNVIYERNR